MHWIQAQHLCLACLQHQLHAHVTVPRPRGQSRQQGKAGSLCSVMSHPAQQSCHAFVISKTCMRGLLVGAAQPWLGFVPHELCSLLALAASMCACVLATRLVQQDPHKAAVGNHSRRCHWKVFYPEQLIAAAGSPIHDVIVITKGAVRMRFPAGAEGLQAAVKEHTVVASVGALEL
jgi:hypothetical protein